MWIIFFLLEMIFIWFKKIKSYFENKYSIVQFMTTMRSTATIEIEFPKSVLNVSPAHWNTHGISTAQNGLDVVFGFKVCLSILLPPGVDVSVAADDVPTSPCLSASWKQFAYRSACHWPIRLCPSLLLKWNTDSFVNKTSAHCLCTHRWCR